MQGFQRYFSITRSIFLLDSRSLAAFRIGLGSLILSDIVLRSVDLHAFYTDAGFLPRELLTGSFARVWNWSLHLVNGSSGFQALLFLLAAVFAAMMAVGYHTRLATFASWLLLVSLHSRNPMILNAGDTYLALLTFWGIFLPLGQVWSLDNWRKEVQEKPSSSRKDTFSNSSISSIATFALCLQIALLYISTGLLKKDVPEWQSGEAIELALLKDYLVTSVGQSMLAFPSLLKTLTHFTVYFEIFGSILLILSRGWLRVFMVTVFILFHLSMAVLFKIGLFPYVCIVAFLALLPPCFWNWVFGEKEATQKTSSRKKHTPPKRSTGKKDLSLWQPALFARLSQRGVLSMALVTMLWSNVQSLDYRFAPPRVLEESQHLLSLASELADVCHRLAECRLVRLPRAASRWKHGQSIDGGDSRQLRKTGTRFRNL